MGKCKITVVKRMLNSELTDGMVQTPCTFFKEGQEFIISDAQQPMNFCSKAWTDIRKDIMIVFFGGNLPWMEQEGTVVTCCTQGIRPVAFKIERID